jgi:hypothetical protein
VLASEDNSGSSGLEEMAVVMAAARTVGKEQTRSLSSVDWSILQSAHLSFHRESCISYRFSLVPLRLEAGSVITASAIGRLVADFDS